MIWNVTVPVLIATVLVLAWRVWRLESKVEFYSDHYRKRCDLNAEAFRDMDMRFEDHRRVIDRLSKNLTSLARALGYEWKRTEAKEGWEKQYVNPFDESYALSALRALEAEICAPPKFPTKRQSKKPTKPRRATH